jgi:hypothetical protein
VAVIAHSSRSGALYRGRGIRYETAVDSTSPAKLVMQIAADVIRGGLLGVAATALTYFWLYILDKPVKKGKKKYFFLVGVLMFGLIAHAVIVGAAYLNAEISAIRKGIVAQQIGRPEIRGSVYNCQVFPVQGGGGGALALFNLRLTNPGKASTAWGWKLGVTLVGGQYYEYSVIDSLDVNLDVKLWTNQPNLVVTKENYLPLMLLRDTVSAERGAHGWLMFQITNIPMSQMGHGTKFTLEFEQSDGSKRTVEHLFTLK